MEDAGGLIVRELDVNGRLDESAEMVVHPSHRFVAG
jgi:hypothetical protein